jgi:hypothetical protein
MKSRFSPRRVMASALLAASLLLASGLAAEGYDAAGLNIAPGSSASELNFAWFSSNAAKKPVVQIAKKADQKGDAFPAAKAKTFAGSSSKAVATQVSGDDKTIVLDSYSDKVTVSGLVDSTDYLYRVGDGKVWSETYAVSTRDQKSFGFLVAGDPQVGSKASGPKTLAGDQAGWQDTMAKATAANPKASFLVSLGDQVNDYNKLETQNAEYAAYFSPAQLRSLPVATIEGNHDFAMGEYYGYHYNRPNVSPLYGVAYGNDGDYWFSYGDALFLMLNSNTESVASHDVFIRDTVAKNPSAKWRIVCFHHSIYSEADHFADPDIVDRRANYAPVFERYKIDVVLQGHDHAYTRTLSLLKGKSVDGADPKAESVTNPTGITYFTFNSASGSKFYDWHDAAPEAFSAARWQGKVPSFGYVSLEGNKFTLTTYKTDDMSVIDSFSIIKN